MTTIEAVYKRRSVKHFDKGHTLTADEERRLLEATVQAPTSFNVQHWRFVIIRDPEIRAHICTELAGDQSQVTDASFLVLFTADVKAWDKAPERYWENTPEQIRERMVAGIRPFHESHGELFQRDEAHWSIGMAMQTLMLVAQEMGYESCPMIGYNLEGVAKLVKLPDDHVMGPMVAIGKGIQDPWPKPGQIPLEELVFEDSF